MENVLDKAVGQIVAEDYRTAEVFKNHNIDFCCQGNRNLEDVANKNNISVTDLLDEIEAIKSKKNIEAVDYKSWPLDLLADYIEKKHHRYVEDRIPALKQYLEKLCRVHGNNHPELLEIDFQFNASASELASHMKKEELILFPTIRRMIQADRTEKHLSENNFESVKNPIQSMMAEHDTEGERFRKIRALSSNYNAPADACNTYRVTFSLLQEFEDDLHRHIHLENNILFPGVLLMEEKLKNR